MTQSCAALRQHTLLRLRWEAGRLAETAGQTAVHQSLKLPFAPLHGRIGQPLLSESRPNFKLHISYLRTLCNYQRIYKRRMARIYVLSVVCPR